MLRRASAGGVELDPKPYDKAVVSTLALASAGEPEGAVWHDIDGDGVMDMAAIVSTTAVWWKQSSTFRGTFGRRYVIGTLPTGGGEGEGMAVGDVNGVKTALAGDQNNGEVFIFHAASGVTSAWTRTQLTGSYPDVHSFIAYDWDGDGDDEFLFCVETGGKVYLADCTGADPTNAAHWTVTEVASIAGARTFAHDTPADIAGNGRGDVVVCCRSSVGGIRYLEAPAAGSIHSTWTATALTGYSWNTNGVSWGCIADMDGNGNRTDIVAFDAIDGAPAYWLNSDGYSTRYALPNPTIDPGDAAWNVIAVPDPAGGRDILAYSYGDQAAGSSTQLDLFVWNGSAWEARDALTFGYGHALESRALAADIDDYGAVRQVLMADSGGVNGGKRMAAFRFYDSTAVPAPTAPTVAQSASNNTTATPVTVTLAGAPTNGNLLLAFCTHYDSAAVVPPAGWEKVHSFISGTDRSSFTVFAKVAASDLAASSWAWTNSGRMHVTVVEVTGADTSDPFVCWGARYNQSTSTTWQNPQIQSDEDNVLVLGMWSWGTTSVGGAPTYPSGFTQLTFTGTQQRGHAVARKEFDAGATGSLNATSASSVGTTCLAVAIRGT